MTSTEPGRRRLSPVLSWGLVWAAVVAGCAQESEPPDPQQANPFAAVAGYADPDSRAAQAAAQAEADGDAERTRVLAQLAGVPQGIWLTPEQYPPGSVGGYVTGVAAAADGAGELPLFVVYGIPDRDCTGGFSQGAWPQPTTVPG